VLSQSKQVFTGYNNSTDSKVKNSYHFFQVNNAGKSGLGDITSSTMEQFDSVMALNIRAVFQLTQLAIPHLIESKGSIVNVSSIAGMVPVSEHACSEYDISIKN